MNLLRLMIGLSSRLLVLISIGWFTLSASAEDALFRLTRIDGTVLESESISIDSSGQVNGKFDGQAISVDELVLIEAGSNMSGESSAVPRLFFVTGGSVALASPVLDQGLLDFSSASGVSSVPLEAVRSIVWEPSDIVTQLIDNPPVDSDAVVVRQGDQLRGVEGVIEGLDNQHVTVRFKGKSRKIGLGKVAAIVMADLQMSLPGDLTAVSVTLAGGGVIKGGLKVWKNELIVIAVGGDVEVEMPVSSLAKMVIENERLVYLSDLEPVSAQQRSMFTFERPWRSDRSVEGNPLTLFDPQQRQKIRFDKGIGTHSWSSLLFANDRGLDRFMATVGIDAETNGRGNCRMIVRGDGIELWSGNVTGMSGPQPVDVSIRGIQSVELEVDPGEEFDLADHANWCNARFVKSK
jgi:cytoskeletal protein CcmA (bactofilin family)